jgi:hypothetical protein
VDRSQNLDANGGPVAHARKIPGANDHIGATRKFNNPRCRGNIPVKVAKKQQFHIGTLNLLKHGAR